MNEPTKMKRPSDGLATAVIRPQTPFYEFTTERGSVYIFNKIGLGTAALRGCERHGAFHPTAD